MKIKSIVFALFLVLFSNGYAQKKELGKVTIAELEEKAHPKDPSAPAAILFEKGEVTFEYTQGEGFVMVLTVKEKIKIYTKEGYEWANKKIPYRLSNKLHESVTFSDAITYNLVGGKIEKTKLKSDGQFEEKVNNYYGFKKIAMPNIKESSIIEYKYVLRSPIIGSLRDWDFQKSIPVNFSEYTTYIPEYYTFNQRLKGYISPKTTVEIKPNFLTIDSKERTVGQGYNGMSSTFSTYRVDFQETVTTYLLENIPALRDESYVNNIENYRASVSNELTTTKYPGELYKTYSTNWESVTNTIYNYQEFGSELNKTGYFEDDLKTVLAGLTTPEEKITALFNYVKATVKWNNVDGYFCNGGVKKAYKDKTGNAAEINLILTAMLRYSGLNANPVLISTRENGIAYYPSLNAFNFVIAAVETPEGLILLDATEKFSEPNVLPLRDLNWVGRLIRKDGTSTEVNLMPKTLSKEATSMTFVLKNDGVTDGKIKRQFTNHDALLFRQKRLRASTETYLEELENNYNDIEINDYFRENELNLSQPMSEGFSFKDTKHVEVINDKIYISPLLFLVANENPFKQEVREYPVDFGYPFQQRLSISLEIPEGYVIETLPKPINIAVVDNISTFKYLISNINNAIQIVLIKSINTPIVNSNYYESLKAFYQQMIDKQNEKIVLKKI